MTGPQSSCLRPLKIGDIEIANRVLLAPMSGVTDAPFRRLAAELGAGLVVSEMTASAALAQSRPDAQLRARGQGLRTHVVQLVGCEARWMGEGARIAEATGAVVIDINMGCPARLVTGGQSGSALMRDLDHAVALIEATVSAVSVPVTCPVLGLSSASGGRCRGASRSRPDQSARPGTMSAHPQVSQPASGSRTAQQTSRVDSPRLQFGLQFTSCDAVQGRPINDVGPA